jgi:hypothetical protein
MDESCSRTPIILSHPHASAFYLRGRQEQASVEETYTQARKPQGHPALSLPLPKPWHSQSGEAGGTPKLKDGLINCRIADAKRNQINSNLTGSKGWLRPAQNWSDMVVPSESKAA